MNIHAVETTASMKAANFSLANVSAGDQIITDGYYVPGDGGAATFIVREKIGNETADETFTYAVGNLIAELHMPNGSVCLDQIGAKGDAVIPDSYNNAVESKTECNQRTAQTFAANKNAVFSATDNQAIFNAAFLHSQVREVRLTAGKVYGIKSPIHIRNNQSLNGCGAAIMNISYDGSVANNIKMLLCYGTASAYAENITIHNLRLIGNYLFGQSSSPEAQAEEQELDVVVGTSDSQGIWLKFAKNIKIQDVQIERCGFGIHSTMGSANRAQGHRNQMEIVRVQIRDALIGIQFNDVKDSCITDSLISTDYTLFENSELCHCIYAGGQSSNCEFRNLVLKNANGGYAINRGEASATECISTGLRFSDIFIDNCSRAIRLSCRTHNTVVRNLTAFRIKKCGVYLSSVENVVISDCRIFVTTECEGAFFISKENANHRYLRNVQVRHCYFEAPDKVIGIGNDRILEGDGLTYFDCRFLVRDVYLSQNKTPAFIKGVVSFVHFQNCSFEVTGHDATQTSELSRNGVFFYFSSDRNKPMYWSFDHCSFINCTDTSINSPILTNRSNDSSAQTVHCGLFRSIMIGYRWTIRKSTTAETNGDSGINPCFYKSGEGINSLSRSTAAENLSATHRFLADDNWYLWNAGNSYSTYLPFSRSESFGVST